MSNTRIIQKIAFHPLPFHSRIAKSFGLAVLVLSFLMPGSAPSQQFAIDWFTIDGGGGTSTGGVYSVSGTIGQPDAGHMGGGNFTLDGGFWGIIAAIQSVGAPQVSIRPTATNTVMVSWPSPSSGFNLQQNTNLLAGTWVAPSESVTDNGTLKFIIVNPPVGNRFYRLSKNLEIPNL
jgi:hypothetical protein